MSLFIKPRSNTPGTTLIEAFKPKAFNFTDGNFDVRSETANSVEILDTATAIDTPRVMTSYFNTLNNVYENTGIDPVYQSKSKRGVRFINKVSDILTLNSDVDTDYKTLIPIEAHAVVTVGLCDLITDEIIMQQLMDAIALGFEILNGNVNSRMIKELRGLVKPKM